MGDPVNPIYVAFRSSYQGESTYTAYLPSGPQTFTVRTSLPDYVVEAALADRPQTTPEERQRRADQYRALVGAVCCTHGIRAFPPREVVEAIAADLNKGDHPPDRYVGARYSQDLSEIEYDGEPPPPPERTGGGIAVPEHARWWNNLYGRREAKG